jgi:hypothetical protein
MKGVNRKRAVGKQCVSKPDVCMDFGLHHIMR